MAARGVVECLGCGENKPMSEYSILDVSGMPRPYCKPCNAERVRLSHYNVTSEFIDLLLLRQQGKCAVCRGFPPEGKTLHIDHDHGCCPGRRSCGRCVRALVCANCNVYGLAWYESLPGELRTFGSLNEYLAHPPAMRLRAELDVLAVG
ncbi:endonuclease VII domain-containing protein [Streptomyces sp. NBC_00075]|uniref:endonuclease domain-containing protein n=1 Tax=Streptomyces sp. NBC_00075 TaxID=2975641 RepID=UPI003250C168